MTRRRYDVVEFTVTRWAHYGLLIESDDGEPGFVDSSYITDDVGEPWPVPGTRLRCVVLAIAKGGRISAAATPGYVAAIASATDPNEAATRWVKENRAGR
jgi:hypothetical protein